VSPPFTISDTLSSLTSQLLFSQICSRQPQRPLEANLPPRMPYNGTSHDHLLHRRLPSFHPQPLLFEPKTSQPSLSNLAILRRFSPPLPSIPRSSHHRPRLVRNEASSYLRSGNETSDRRGGLEGYHKVLWSQEGRK